MARHISIIAEQIEEFKHEYPEEFQKLLDEGIKIGRGEFESNESDTKLTKEEIYEKYIPEEPDLAEITKAVIEGNSKKVSELTQNLLDKGTIDPTSIVLKALMPGIQVVCEIYDMGDAFVPEVLLANDALLSGVKLCQELLGDIPSKGKIASLVVEGDVHDIGKNIVVAILRANGYDVIDLGRDVPSEDVVNLVEKGEINLVTGTSLMSTTKAGLKTLSKELEPYNVPVACGGAAVDEMFVDTFTNSIYGKSPLDAVNISNQIMDGKTWEEIREASSAKSKQKSKGKQIAKA